MNSIQIESNHVFFEIIEDVLQQGHKVKFTVSGNSMYPFLSDNRDQVLLEKVAINGLKRGDIILYRNKAGKYILHRIQKRVLAGYQTIGDACQCPDEPVPASNIIAKVNRIYRKGREISCSSLTWYLLSYLWLIIHPYREQIIGFYRFFNRYKRKLFMKERSWNRARE